MNTLHIYGCTVNPTLHADILSEDHDSIIALQLRGERLANSIDQVHPGAIRFGYLGTSLAFKKDLLSNLGEEVRRWFAAYPLRSVRLPLHCSSLGHHSSGLLQPLQQQLLLLR